MIRDRTLSDHLHGALPSDAGQALLEHDAWDFSAQVPSARAPLALAGVAHCTPAWARAVRAVILAALAYSAAQFAYLCGLEGSDSRTVSLVARAASVTLFATGLPLHVEQARLWRHSAQGLGLVVATLDRDARERVRAFAARAVRWGLVGAALNWAALLAGFISGTVGVDVTDGLHDSLFDTDSALFFVVAALVVPAGLLLSITPTATELVHLAVTTKVLRLVFLEWVDRQAGAEGSPDAALVEYLALTGHVSAASEQHQKSIALVAVNAFVFSASLFAQAVLDPAANKLLFQTPAVLVYVSIVSVLPVLAVALSLGNDHIADVGRHLSVRRVWSSVERLAFRDDLRVVDCAFKVYGMNVDSRLMGVAGLGLATTVLNMLLGALGVT